MHFHLVYKHTDLLFLFTFFFWSCYPNALPNVIYNTIYVDQSGKGNFSTIQGAIDNIPLNNINWIRIHIKAGIYREQVIIPMEKPFIFLEGEGKWNTTVSWDGHDKLLNKQATFMSLADDLVVKYMGFTNTFNYPPGSNKNNRTQAVAALIQGDRCAFYDVAFLGVQDTLWDSRGRHYFLACTIRGSVDFIFGAGQSFYERCIISAIAASLNVSLGYITAQGRSSALDTNGFVFKDCNITGDGVSMLGRAWRPYAMTIFLYTTMENIIHPVGWMAWNAIGQEHNLLYAEYGCTGLGANKSNRVSWATNLTPVLVEKYENIKFVDEEGWIVHQP